MCDEQFSLTFTMHIWFPMNIPKFPIEFHIDLCIGGHSSISSEEVPEGLDLGFKSRPVGLKALRDGVSLGVDSGRANRPRTGPACYRAGPDRPATVQARTDPVNRLVPGSSHSAR
ncbi:unnamed protein product [Cuscuta europaea]|uniref:Uncharacterized protein n=1 Tax=Cuscuta europaea TaxID=41803 RepID=A0A9P1E1A5_CUSEU|nr:unnamed protein product [Cuscuta europaea]